MSKYNTREFKVPKETETLSFYCNHCDGAIVNSDYPETGKFYITWGHVWKGIGKESPMNTAYEAVINAVCTQCLNGETKWGNEEDK